MAQTKPSATTSTSLPTTKPTSVSAADLEAVDRVLGHAYTPEEREMMRGGMASKQGVITKLRKRTIPPDVEPAVRFDPRLPETKVPTGASSFSMSDAAAPAWRTWR